MSLQLPADFALTRTMRSHILCPALPHLTPSFLRHLIRSSWSECHNKNFPTSSLNAGYCKMRGNIRMSQLYVHNKNVIMVCTH